MNNKIQIIILLGYLLSACNVTPKNQNNTLVPYLLTDNGVNSKIKLSEIITRHYRIIPLETKAKCLVGKIDKIIKRDSVFYILSNERKIETFNQEGKHLSTLEKNRTRAGRIHVHRGFWCLLEKRPERDMAMWHELHQNIQRRNHATREKHLLPVCCQQVQENTG